MTEDRLCILPIVFTLFHMNLVVMEKRIATRHHSMVFAFSKAIFIWKFALFCIFILFRWIFNFQLWEIPWNFDCSQIYSPETNSKRTKSMLNLNTLPFRWIRAYALDWNGITLKLARSSARQKYVSKGIIYLITTFRHSFFVADALSICLTNYFSLGIELERKQNVTYSIYCFWYWYC